MFSYNDPINENQEQLELEVAKLEKLLLGKDFKSLDEAQQIAFCQTRRLLGLTYYKLSVCNYKKEDYLNAATYFQKGHAIVSIDKINWPKDNKALVTWSSKCTHLVKQLFSFFPTSFQIDWDSYK